MFTLPSKLSETARINRFSNYRQITTYTPPRLMADTWLEHKEVTEPMNPSLVQIKVYKLRILQAALEGKYPIF